MSDSEQTGIRPGNCGPGAGKLFLVGIGPGGVRHRTPAMLTALAQSQVVVGYTSYIESIQDLLDRRRVEVIKSGMRKEKDRVQAALNRAADGSIVSLISSGDPGVYGMAGLALEMAAGQCPDLDIEIVPGISAVLAAAAALGAPLMLDFTVISLSDLLVPWSQIEKRLKAAAECGLVTALYNPKSQKRVTQIEKAAAIFLRFLAPQTPVGVVTGAGRNSEKKEIITLVKLASAEITMSSIVIIPGPQARMLNGWLVTSRGYEL